MHLTGTGFIAGAAAGPSRWFIVHLAAAVGALLLVPAAAGVRTLVVGGGRRLATTAAVTAAVGSVTLSLGLAAEASVLRLAATAGIAPAAALRLAGSFVRPPSFWSSRSGSSQRPSPACCSQRRC